MNNLVVDTEAGVALVSGPYTPVAGFSLDDGRLLYEVENVLEGRDRFQPPWTLVRDPRGAGRAFLLEMSEGSFNAHPFAVSTGEFVEIAPLQISGEYLGLDPSGRGWLVQDQAGDPEGKLRLLDWDGLRNLGGEALDSGRFQSVLARDGSSSALYVKQDAETTDVYEGALPGPVPVLVLPREPVRGVLAASADGSRLALDWTEGEDEDSLRVLDLEARCITLAIPGLYSHVRFLPDGNLATVGAGGVVRIHDGSTGEVLHQRRVHWKGILHLALLEERSKLLVVRQVGGMDLLDLETLESRPRLDRFLHATVGLWHLPGDREIAVDGFLDGVRRLSLWDKATGACLGWFPRELEPRWISPDGGSALLGSRIWDLVERRSVRELPESWSEEGLVLTSDRRRAVLLGDPEAEPITRLRMLEVASGRRLWRFPGEHGEVHGAVLAGKSIVLGSHREDAPRLNVLELDTGRVLERVTLPESWAGDGLSIRELHWSPEAGLVVGRAAGYTVFTNTLFAVDPEEGTVKWTRKHECKSLRAGSVSAVGTFVCATMADVEVLSVSSGETVWKLGRKAGDWDQVSLAHDGRSGVLSEAGSLVMGFAVETDP
jgi:hypothetical protein